MSLVAVIQPYFEACKQVTAGDAQHPYSRVSFNTVLQLTFILWEVYGQTEFFITSVNLNKHMKCQMMSFCLLFLGYFVAFDV